MNGGIVGGTIGVGGVAGGPQNFPFAAQRRAQLAQQGLGGMGGMRPPGKSGLSFDVILSRLQGELQKSRETGAELNSLNGAMNEIHDTLGGTLVCLQQLFSYITSNRQRHTQPTSLPMFPSTLPPVRPPQEAPPPPVAGSSHASPEQPPSQSSSAVSASAVLDLQSQLRDTQSSLASHLDKVRALEGVIAEQEAMKREVRTLREVMEERRREMDLERAQQEERIRREIEEARRPPDLHRAEQEQEPRGGFDLEDEEDEREDDEDDDTRSVSTIMAHELERVEEEDEEQLAEDERQQERQDVESGRREKAKEGEAQFEAEAQAEEEERRREDLGVGRPRTPEPTRLGLLGASVPRRASLSSPLSQVSSSELRNGTTPDDVYEQVVKLSKQVGAVMALTSSLEAQHSAAQGTIQALETKVESLETMLRAAEEALAKAQQPQAPPPAPKEVVEVEGLSLVDKMAEWKKAVEGQWGTVQEEWTHERERLSKAREEWESKLRQVDSGLEKMASLQSTLTTQQQQIQVQLQHHQQLQQSSMHSFHHIGNGDILKHNGGLVTPPSPRSQSSDSGRYRRRRRRSSGSRGRSSSGERAATGSVEGDDDPDTDATLASSVEDEIEAKLRLANGKILGSGHAAERSLATPEPSVYKLSSSLGSLYADPNSKVRSNSEDTASSKLFAFIRRLLLICFAAIQHASIGSLSSSPLADSTTSANDADSYSVPPPNINMQTAVGVLILSVAAAAVFWKVKPE